MIEPEPENKAAGPTRRTLFQWLSYGLSALAAAALGADMLELHVVFSRECFGPDTQASVTTADLTQLVEGVRFIERAVAAPVDKEVMASELAELRRLFGKSVVALRDLAVGDRLAEADLGLKKPGTGIPAVRLRDLLNRRLKRPVAVDSLLSEEDVE